MASTSPFCWWRLCLSTWNFATKTSKIIINSGSDNLAKSMCQPNKESTIPWLSHPCRRRFPAQHSPLFLHLSRQHPCVPTCFLFHKKAKANLDISHLTQLFQPHPAPFTHRIQSAGIQKVGSHVLPRRHCDVILMSRSIARSLQRLIRLHVPRGLLAHKLCVA